MIDYIWQTSIYLSYCLSTVHYVAWNSVGWHTSSKSIQGANIHIHIYPHLIPGIHLCLIFQQILHGANISTLSCPMKSRSLGLQKNCQLARTLETRTFNILLILCQWLDLETTTHQCSQCTPYCWISVSVMGQQIVFNFRKVNIYILDNEKFNYIVVNLSIVFNSINIISSHW
jgi:hypothetical protein